MTDKAISDNTEVTTLADDDFFVVELANGNTRKIRKSNVNLGGRLAPSIVQKATLRLDGTIALGVAPTVGNLLVLSTSGFGGSLAAYVGTGFQLIGSYSSNANNTVMIWAKRVRAGETGSYAITASDNQQAVLYEVADCVGVVGLGGGAMSGFFTGTNFTMPVLDSPFGPSDLRLISMTHDTTPVWTITAETGLTVDFAPAADGNNHTGAFATLTSAHDDVVAGSLSGTPVQPAFGVFALIGAPE